MTTELGRGDGWRERAYCAAVELLVAVLRVWTVALEVPARARRAVPFLVVALLLGACEGL